MPLASRFGKRMHGLKTKDVIVGTGETVTRGSVVSIRWRGRLNRGDEFGSGTMTFCVGRRQVIAGLEHGVIGMRAGGVRRLRVSPHLGYRDQAVPGVPANAVLGFEVELLHVESSVAASMPTPRQPDEEPT
jgi:FKBP-type peptidyl-prolyl cis-trans isomerase